MNVNQTVKRDRLVAFLQQRPGLIPRVNPMPWLIQESVLTVDQYSEVLLADAEFRSIQLGSFLGTPDGEIIGGAVGMLIPPIYKPEFDLLVDGLTYAAQLQAREGRQAAGKIALVVVSGGLLLFGLAKAENKAA
jgi:hypothetical protein